MKFDEKRSGRKPQDHHRRGPRPAKAPRSAFAAMESMDHADIPAEQENTTLIEGRNAITEALRSGRPMDKIFLAEGVQGVQHILAMAKEAGIAVQWCDRRKLDKMTITGAHQGMMAQCAAAEYKTIDDILELAASRSEDPLVVLCDGITDPHNLGAIIRSAEVLGAHGVVVPRHRSAGLNAACAKSAAGALEYLPVAKCANMQTAVLELQKKGLFVFAADMNGQTLWETNLTMPCALVIGSEGNGVSKLVRDTVDGIISIPQKGKINSLNASNAAAVLLSEVCRQRG